MLARGDDGNMNTMTRLYHKVKVLTLNFVFVVYTNKVLVQFFFLHMYMCLNYYYNGHT